MGARFYLFGAQAALLHGSSRLSADVDVTVVEPVDVDALVRSLRALDFALRVEDPAFVATTRVLPFMHLASRVPVDLVLGASGLEEMTYERAIKRRIGGAEVPVADAADLVIMKVLAGRPKDREDVAAVVRANPTIDRAHIKATLEQLEDALGEGGLVARFDEFVR